MLREATAVEEMYSTALRSSIQKKERGLVGAPTRLTQEEANTKIWPLSSVYMALTLLFFAL